MKVYPLQGLATLTFSYHMRSRLAILCVSSLRDVGSNPIAGIKRMEGIFIHERNTHTQQKHTHTHTHTYIHTHNRPHTTHIHGTDWFTKGRVMYFHVYVMMHVEDP